MGLFPPPACRAERGGRGAAGGCAPKAGDAFRGGVKPSVPGTRNFSGETQHSPLQLPAKCVLPAPRAGASPILQTSRGTPAPPGTMNLLFPTRAGVIQSVFVKQSPRVYPRNCSRTHLQYTNAFLQNFKNQLYFVFPAPTFTPVGAGGVSP